MTVNNVFLWGLLLFATTCGLQALGAELPAAVTSDPLVVAYLHGGKLYCLRVQERFGESAQPLKPMELCQAKLTSEGRFKKEKQLIHGVSAYERLPDRWRVSHGYFWWQADHTSHDSGSGDLEELTRIPLKQVSIPLDDPRRDALEYEWGLPIGPPVHDLRIAARSATKRDVYFDLIP